MNKDKKNVKKPDKNQRIERGEIENPRGFMAMIDIFCILLLVIGLFLGVRYMLNEVFIRRYNEGTYSKRYEKLLVKLNFPESYLVYYNMGNVDYKNEHYDEAIENYKKALEMNPSHKGDRECNIRVNLALAMLQKVDWMNLTTEKDVQRAIRQLKAARNILTEEGCANPDDPNGHNKDAEQLKKDIDDMLDKLQQQQDNQDQNQDQDNQDNQDQNQDEENQDEGNSDSKREDDVKEQLEKQKEEGMQEKQQAEYEKDKEQGGGGGSDYSGKTW